MHLGERAGKAQAAGEAQPDSLLGESKGRGWGAGTACVGRKGDKRALVPTVSPQRKPKTFSHLPAVENKENRDAGSRIKEQSSQQKLHQVKDLAEPIRQRGEQEREKSKAKVVAAHLVHQGGEGKRSG